MAHHNSVAAEEAMEKFERGSVLDEQDETAMRSFILESNDVDKVCRILYAYAYTFKPHLDVVQKLESYIISKDSVDLSSSSFKAIINQWGIESSGILKEAIWYLDPSRFEKYFDSCQIVCGCLQSNSKIECSEELISRCKIFDLWAKKIGLIVE